MRGLTSDIGSLRVAVLSREGESSRRIAWITAGANGLSMGVARGAGPGTRYIYQVDGAFYRLSAAQESGRGDLGRELIRRHPPLSGITGLVHLIAVNLYPGDRLIRLPFKRKFERVYVKQYNGRVSFKVGLLEPGVPEALDSIKSKEERHFHLITKIQPWILFWNAAGFEASSTLGTRRPPGPPRFWPQMA